MTLTTAPALAARLGCDRTGLLRVLRRAGVAPVVPAGYPPARGRAGGLYDEAAAAAAWDARPRGKKPSAGERAARGTGGPVVRPTVAGVEFSAADVAELDRRRAAFGRRRV